jgi:hypothetical protein
VPFTVVGGARDGPNAARSRSPVLVRIDGKIGPAAVIHPHSSAVKSPAITLIARRTTALIYQAHSAPRIRWTVVAMAIVGGAGEGLRRTSWTENDKRGSNQTQKNPILRTNHSRPPQTETTNRLAFLKISVFGPYLWAGPCELEPEDPELLLIRGPAVLPAGAETLEEPPAGNRAEDAAAGARIVPLLGPDEDAGRSTCCEILPKLRTLPRATPRPAESLRMFDLPWITPVAPAGAPRLTIKVCPGAVGILGALKCCGAFTMRGTVFHPVQVLPGCQNHP